MKARAARNCAGRARCVMSPDSTSRSGRCCRASAASASTTGGCSVPKCGSEICSRTLIRLSRRGGPRCRWSVAVVGARHQQVQRLGEHAEVERRAHPRHLAVEGHLHPAAAGRERGPHHHVLELEALHALRFAECAHRAMQHQPDHRQRADRPQHDRGDAAVAGRAGQRVLAAAPRTAPVAAGCCPRTASASARREPLRPCSMCRRSCRCARSSVAQAAQNATQRLRPKRALYASRSSSRSGYSPRLALTRNTRSLTAATCTGAGVRTQQQARGLGRIGRNAMRAGEVVERALRHHAHGAARGVRGLRHRVEGAVAADGDHGRAGGDGPWSQPPAPRGPARRGG